MNARQAPRRLVAGLVAAVVVVAGCVVEETSQVPVLPPSGGSQAPAPGDSATTSGGTLRIGLGVEPVSLDPRFVVDAEGEIVVDAVFESLVRLDDHLRPVAGAAEQWTIDESRTTYRFTLRQADFHDGAEVTAHAFKRTFDRIADGTLNPRSPLDFLVEGIIGARQAAAVGGGLAGVIVEADDLLTIRLERPDAGFLSRLAHPGLAPVPASADEDPEGFAEQPVGNGPFAMIEPRARGAFIRLTRHEDHHRAPQLDEVLINFYLDDPSTTRQWQDVVNGNLHVARLTADLIDDAVERFGRSEDGYTGPGVLDGVTTTVYAYAFNTTRPPFDDADARRAWSLAIDRGALADGVMRGSRTAADSLVPPSVPGYLRGACEYCRHDPQRAAELWQDVLNRWPHNDADEGEGATTPEAIDPDVQPDELEATDEADTDELFVPTITLLHPRGATHAAIAQRMAADLEQALTVTINLRAEDLGRFVRTIRDGEAQVFRLGWEPSEPDPGAYLTPLFHSREIGRDNLTGWSTQQVDALLDEARASMSSGAALARYREAERLVLDEMPVMPLLYYRQAAVVVPDVEGFVWSATGRVDLTRVTLRR
ncbi:MAG: ABC transporter substrate-binding protein [Nitriliruptoraceae bacterium]